jgi:Uma2 family endonuclease
MYDLPSEDPTEPGLPDEYHYLQPQLLSATLRLSAAAEERAFSVGDMNLYFDPDHPLWHKSPDWFLVLGVPRLYDERDMRLSYVVWQEEVSPFMVVELLSPGTEKEDLGETEAIAGQPPTKWEVYERILQIPYYILFDRYTSQLQAFRLQGERYQRLDIPEQRLWVPELDLGLGVWQGICRGVPHQWLRWFDAEDQWILTGEESAEKERQRAEAAEEKLRRILTELQDRGIDPNELL